MSSNTPELAARDYSVVLSSEGGVWLVEVPALKGVRSLGRTIPAAVGNIREAIAAEIQKNCVERDSALFRFPETGRLSAAPPRNSCGGVGTKRR